jgi:hypothetical protein
MMTLFPLIWSIFLSLITSSKQSSPTVPGWSDDFNNEDDDNDDNNNNAT